MYFKKIKINFFKETFLKKISIVVGGTALGNLIAVIASPVLTRLFSPQEFGIFSVFISLGGLFSSFACLSYERAIQIPRIEEESFVLAIISIIFSIVVGVLLFALFLLINFLELNIKIINQLNFFVYILPIFVVSSSIYNAFSCLAIRLDKFTDLAKTRVWQKIIGTSVQILCGIASFGTIGLIFGGIIGQSGGSWNLKKKLIGKGFSKIKSIPYGNFIFLIKRYKNFPMFSAPAALMNVAANDLLPIFLLSFYNGEVAGFFALGQRVIQTPLSFISEAVSQVYVREVAKLKYDDPKSLLPLLYNTTKRMAIIGILPCVAVFLGGGRMFALIFGNHWHEAGVYSQILSILVYIRFIVAPLCQLNVLEKQKTVLLWNFLRLSGVLICMVFAYLQNMNPILFLKSYLFIMILLYGLNYVLYRKAVIEQVNSII